MQQWKEYFVFTKRERSGILVLLSLITVLLVTPWFFPDNPEALKQVQWIQLQSKLDSQHNISSSRSFTYDNKYSDDRKNGAVVRLFYFDPNTIDEAEWIKLGLRPKTAQTIRKYISKGGRFKSAKDLGKIYSLSKEDYTRLVPYVRIESQHENQPGYKANEEYLYDRAPDHLPNKHNNPSSFSESTKSPKSKRSQFRQLNINTADSLAFVELPGIGPKLASRILNFRKRLGGFYSVEQVAETYGLPDSTFQLVKEYLECNSSAIKPISINAATIEDLKQHPYIKWNLASAIIEYRKQHGPYKSIEDLLKISAMEEKTFSRIKPYFVCDPETARD